MAVPPHTFIPRGRDFGARQKGISTDPLHSGQARLQEGFREPSIVARNIQWRYKGWRYKGWRYKGWKA